MIDRELLQKVTKIVTHAHCPDGMASAILLHDALEEEVIFLSHGTPEYEELRAEPGMLFCDITPPAARLEEFVAVNAIVLDHHVKQREIVERFHRIGPFPRGVYSDEPGVSGAMLAFREVWAHTTTPGSDSYNRAESFATLAGVRDTWQTKDRRWAMSCVQAEALRFYPWKFFERIERPFGHRGSTELQNLLEIGPMLYDQRIERAKSAVENAYGAISDTGTRILVVPTIETSDIAEIAGDQADVVAGFAYRSQAGGDGKPSKVVLQLSMRAKGGYDVGNFCAALGGGGHRAAAGATIPVTNGDLNPYQTIVKLIVDHERGAP